MPDHIPVGVPHFISIPIKIPITHPIEGSIKVIIEEHPLISSNPGTIPIPSFISVKASSHSSL